MKVYKNPKLEYVKDAKAQITDSPQQIRAELEKMSAELAGTLQENRRRESESWQYLRDIRGRLLW